MYQKICSKNVFLAIAFIMIHIHVSMAHIERNANLKKFLKYDNKRTFWLKQKRTSGYRDPCGTETNEVDTSSYDTSCSDCTYMPNKLTEVKCTTNGLTQSSCKYGVAGDCLDVQATIKVLKIFSNKNWVYHDVVLKVGCACHLLPA